MVTEETLQEETLQSAVIELARVLGWRVAHFRPARTASGWRTPVQADGKGFPDLVLVNRKQKRLIVAELKSAKGKPSADQQQWLDDFRACNVETHLWTPNDWPERITEILSGFEVRVTVA